MWLNYTHDVFIYIYLQYMDIRKNPRDTYCINIRSTHSSASYTQRTIHRASR